MKRVLTIAVLVTGLSGCATTADSGSTSSSTQSSAHKYKTCASMNKRYPYGVGKKGAKDETHGTRRPTANYKVSYRLYQANRKLDRDDDGIACESPNRTSSKLKDGNKHEGGNRKDW